MKVCGAARRRLIGWAILANAGWAGAAGLPPLGASVSDITVSGISSGGYMAVQFQVAHSATVAGAGVLAAGPYDCAGGSTWAALTRCMSPRSWSPLPAPESLRARAERRAAAGEIDHPRGLQGDRVWIFSGDRDHTVERPVVEALTAFYAPWVAGEALRFVTREDAGHAMPSVEDPAANACPTSEPPFINRCGDFDAAGELLAHLIGPLAAKQEPPAEALQSFDQRPFLGKPVEASGMADEGLLFVPADCRAGGCRLHVAFHGCRQTTAQVGRRFAENAGYLEWAQSNRLIVLFPQVIPRNGWTGGFSWVFNPRGCWDWWGYTGPEYATREGRQMRAVKAMVERLGEAPAR